MKTLTRLKPVSVTQANILFLIPLSSPESRVYLIHPVQKLG